MSSLDLERKKKQATDLLVNGQNEEAVALLQHIVEVVPDDTDVLLELANGYWQLTRYVDAKKIYQQVLKLNPGNPFVIKKLSLISMMLERNSSPKSNAPNSRRMHITELIEEPGRTKSVRLSTIGKHDELGLLSVGEEVFLNIRKRKIEVRDGRKNFVGYLPDDISKRLIDLMNGGATYEAFMHVVDKQECRVFVREVKKPAKFSNVASFPLDSSRMLDTDEEESSNQSSGEDEEEIDLDSEETIIPTKDLSVNEGKKKRSGNDDDDEDEEDEEDEDEPIYREYEE